MAQPDSLREVAFRAWDGLLYTAYRWAGDDPMDGVDCSGFVLEGLQAAGLVKREFDTTADGLLSHVFGRLPRITMLEHFRRGMLVFWGRGGKPVHHVEVIVGSYPATEGLRVITIGASGGGSTTVDPAAATAQNAYVKLRPLMPGWVAAVDPW